MLGIRSREFVQATLYGNDYTLTMSDLVRCCCDDFDGMASMIRRHVSFDAILRITMRLMNYEACAGVSNKSYLRCIAIKQVSQNPDAQTRKVFSLPLSA